MKEKIAVIGPCVNMGGIERASATVANYAKKQGFNVLYLAIFKHPRFFELEPGIEYDEPLDGSNITSINIFKTIKRIRKKITAYNPDAIIAFNKFYASIALIALAGTGKKVYISERSSPFYKWPKKPAVINKLATYIKKPAGLLAQTGIAAEYQKKYYGNLPSVVVPNALRKVALYPEIKREKWILAVGRFGDPLKGFDRLISAYAKVRNKDWKLVFAGGDEDGQELKDMAKELGVLDNVLFLGRINEIDKVYAQAGIFVIPSRSEGFPNALSEAMAAGVPCISFDFTAGPRDIISNSESGLIVEDGNIDKLAEAIDDLIENKPKREMFAENAMKSSARFDENLIGKKIIDFILQ